MPWPSSIKITELEKCSAEYNEIALDCGQRKMLVHEDLYRGGNDFRMRIDSYLDKRKLEEKGGLRAENLKQETVTTTSIHNTSSSDNWLRRKKISRYIPIVAGKLDFICAALHGAEPSIVATSTVVEKVASFLDLIKSIFIPRVNVPADYWSNLNRNCDGDGKNVGSLSRELFLDLSVHHCAYIGLNFPDTDEEFASLADQKKAGALDVTWSRVSPQRVNDKGTFEGEDFLRIYSEEEGRSLPYGDADSTIRTWVFATETRWITYQAIIPKDSQVNKPVDAEMISNKPHPFGAVPVVRLEVPYGLWLMDRLRETILALFNRSSSLTYSLNQMAFSLLVLQKMTGPLSQDCIDPDTGALILESGEAVFVAPEVGIFQALDSDVTRLEKSIDNIIQAAALSAASRDTQGRQSGVAKFREFGSIATLLDAFGSILRDGFESAIALTKKVRGDDVPILLEGLDKFDVQSLEIKTDQAIAVLGLPVTDTFKKYILTMLQLAHAQNASPEIRAKILEEVAAMTPEQMKMMVQVTADQNQNQDMRSGKKIVPQD